MSATIEVDDQPALLQEVLWAGESTVLAALCDPFRHRKAIDDRSRRKQVKYVHLIGVRGR